MKFDVVLTVTASNRDYVMNYINEDIGFYLCLLKLLVPSTANLPTIFSKLIIFSDVSLKC